MGIVSGGGGGSFNGGTITTPLAIDVAVAAAPGQFSVVADNLPNSKLNARLKGTESLLQLNDEAGAIARISTFNNFFTPRSDAATNSAFVEFANIAGDDMLLFLADGTTVICRATVPPDADLAASQVALWLDATPAATKLMVKAKDSGGTVRTAAIALS